MRKKGILVLVTMLCLTLVTAGVSFAVSPMEQAKIIAGEQFSQGWELFSSETWDTLGFDSLEQAQKAHLGSEPVMFKQINLEEFDKTIPVKDQLNEIPKYYFPIIADGKIIADFEVRLDDGEWEVGRIGGKLCNRLDKVAKANGIAIDDCSVVNCTTNKIFIANINGKEKAIKYTGEMESLIMNYSSADLVRECAEAYQKLNTEKNLNPEEIVVYDNTAQYYKSEFYQKDTITERLIRFIKYYV